MKTPPFLLGAALLFWGWQSGFLLIGAIMALILESSRWIDARWEFSDLEFERIWTFCSVLFLAAAVYAFTANEGPARLSRMLQNPNFANQTGAGLAGTHAVLALFRWLPMLFFLFVATQAYSSRQEIPWSTMSLILRWRWKKAQKSGRPAAARERGVNAGFPYFGLCLFSASSHPSEASSYFWGVCGLVAWALWTQRSRRFRPQTWMATFLLAIALGFVAEKGLGRLQNYITRFNAGLLLRFMRGGTDPTQTWTSIGKVGRLKLSGEIVIRLKPLEGAPPTYLRDASYRIFSSPVWAASKPVDNFSEVTPETNGTTVILVAGKTNRASTQIACYLKAGISDSGESSGLLPMPTGSGRLENLPAFAVTIRTNRTGAVLAEGPGLVIFDACHAPGVTLDSPPNRKLDLNVAPEEDAALEKVISDLHLTSKNPDAVMQAVYAYFQDRFSYSTWQEEDRHRIANETPLARFLLETRSGHCEYFATATALLLRKLDIPTRYAVGYAVHEMAGKGYVVRQRDAHAWCLVWDERTRTWQDFDTTPPSWVDEESKRASLWERVRDAWSWLKFQFSKFRWGQTHLRRYLLLALAPVLGLLLFQIIFRRKRQGRKKKKPGTESVAAWPGRDSEFYLIEKKLAGRGILRPPNEALSAWLQRTAHDPALAEVRSPLQTLLRLHYRYRFDPLSLNDADRAELRRESALVLENMGGQTGKRVFQFKSRRRPHD